MRSPLPSPLFGFSRLWPMIRALGVGGLLLACGKPSPPVAPGPPIAADPPLDLRGMEEECDAMIGAIARWKECPHLEQEDREDIDSYIERATKDLVAGRKAKPEPDAQKAIARACLRATRSVQAATERCEAGPPPKDDWYYPRR